MHLKDSKLELVLVLRELVELLKSLALDDLEEINFLLSKLNQSKSLLLNFDKSIHSFLLGEEYENQNEFEDDCEPCEKYIDNINRMLSKLNIAISSLGPCLLYTSDAADE